jgi:hypothetical protein
MIDLVLRAPIFLARNGAGAYDLHYTRRDNLIVPSTRLISLQGLLRPQCVPRLGLFCVPE